MVIRNNLLDRYKTWKKYGYTRREWENLTNLERDKISTDASVKKQKEDLIKVKCSYCSETYQIRRVALRSTLYYGTKRLCGKCRVVSATIRMRRQETRNIKKQEILND